MKNSLLLLASLALCFAFITAGASAPPTNTATAIPLRVTIEPQDSSFTACKICGDGLGEYIDGANGVAANIDKYGNLIIDFQTARTPLRRVDFEYSSAFQATSNIPPSGLQADAYLSTFPRSDDTSYVLMQNMQVGDAAAQCVQLGWTFAAQDATPFRNSFHHVIGSNVDITATSYAVITRRDVNTWEVEPKASPCNSGVPTVAKAFTLLPAKGNQIVFTDYGLYYLPFKLTLRRR